MGDHHIWSFPVPWWLANNDLAGCCELLNFIVDDRDLLAYLDEGSRLKKPEACSADLYRIMTMCWSDAPDIRPVHYIFYILILLICYFNIRLLQLWFLFYRS